MPRRFVLLLLPTLAALAACNMVISEMPVFAETDRGPEAPKDGLWIGEDPECRFDPAGTESGWPDCAIWVVVREAGAMLLVSDRKGEPQRVGALFVAGNPGIIQARWVDDAKEPARPYYAFYAFEARDIDSMGRFTLASIWPVECGIQDKPNGDIRPFPGISAECRPSSADSIRSAAKASRRADLVKEWRRLRAEKP